LTRAASAAGIDMEVLTLDTRGEPFLADWPVPVHAVGPAAGPLAWNYRLGPWLREHARQYDALIVHTLWRYLGFAVRRALRGSKTRYFVRPHGGLNTRQVRQSGGVRYIEKRLWWLLSDSRVCRDAGAVLFTCEDEQRQARFLLGRSGTREFILPNGICDPPQGEPFSAPEFFRVHPSLQGKRLLLFLGRLHPDKGCDHLIRGAARANLPDSVHLVIAGPDAAGMTVNLLRLARELKVAAAITLTGPLYGPLKWAALRAAEALILPSHSEACPYAILEALACGIPTLTTNRVGIRGNLEEAECGLIDDPTPEGIERLLRRWSATPAMTRSQMAANAHQLFTTHFRASVTASMLREIVTQETAPRQVPLAAVRAQPVHP